LYAQWSNAYFNLRVDPNGGGGSATVYVGGLQMNSSYTAPGNLFGFTAPAGTDFAGWTVTPGNTVPDYYPGQTVPIVMSDVTLYAVWGNLHTITYIDPNFYASYTKGGATAAQTGLPAGSKVTLTANGFYQALTAPPNTSKTFKWWSGGPSGNLVDQATIVMPDSDLTLLAQYY
jgi:hypothetical protein